MHNLDEIRDRATRILDAGRPAPAEISRTVSAQELRAHLESTSASGEVGSLPASEASRPFTLEDLNRLRQSTTVPSPDSQSLVLTNWNIGPVGVL